MVDGRFSGKVALVTGSTQGIGESAARRFAAEGAAGVVVTGRDAGRGERVRQALTDLGTEAVFISAELEQAAACRELVAAADAHFGRIDILVNAAALTYRGTIVDTTAELWNQLMDVNVRAPFLLMQGAIAIMRREKIPGSIVNVGSVAAHGGPTFLLPYSVTKGALVPLVKNVAYSVMWDGIRVNLLQPGWMDTPGEHAIQQAAHDAPDDWLAEAEAVQPFGRLIKPDELAKAITFLASDESGMMTGAVIDFDQSVIGAGQQPIPSREETPQ